MLNYDNEKENNLVTYRKHGSTEQITVTLQEFIDLVNELVVTKQ